MKRLLLLLLLFVSLLPLKAQSEGFRIAFYNVENLFDTDDNPLTADDEYLPDGNRRWTHYRYDRKQLRLMQALGAMAADELPAVIGLCEVESEEVLRYLTRATPFGSAGYRYFLTESPDPRGINIAFLYRRERFRPIARYDYRITPPAGFSPTRDVLHICGHTVGGDTLDILFCHLPSRRGGQAASQPARTAVHRRLLGVVDSLTAVRTEPRVVVMGDFNDYPADLPPWLASPVPRSAFVEAGESGASIMRFGDSPVSTETGAPLLNLMSAFPRGKGSYKYQGEWGFLDQILVSPALIRSDGERRVRQVGVVDAPFLLTDDTTYGGLRPFRTYYGYRYEGGFSDHLPVFVDL